MGDPEERRGALEVEDHAADNDDDAKGVPGDEDEFEDEQALFAKHDAMDVDHPRRKKRAKLLLIPALLCVFVALAIAAVILTVGFSTSQGPALEACIPMKVPVPSVSEMTLPEKVGQMMQINQLALERASDVAEYFIGSILSGGGGAPRWGNTAKDWADLVDDLQAKVKSTRLQIPTVYGADAVHGHNNVVGATIFPHHVGMGAARNPQLMQRVAASAAKEVMGTGVRWTFSPAVSVCQDPRWGRCYESFSSLPNLVTLLSMPEILGFQDLPEDWPSTNIMQEGVFIAATAKHYVADGGTQGGRDRGDADIAEAELRDVHLPPYLTAISSGVLSIMVSYSSWNGEPMHKNKYLLTEVLREELEFKGVLVSDWQAIQLLPGNFSIQVRDAIMAGIDMVMVPDDYKGFAATLIDLVERGLVPMERIEEAVGRILQFKQKLGLFEDACARRDFLPLVGAREHRKIAREAVRESLVLLKNADRSEDGGPIFPLLTDGKTFLLIGKHANDLGLQCGGWTITWQGTPGRITTGTTILEGFQEVAAKSTPSTAVVYQERYDGSTVADYGIIVVGEQPYAEYYGDSSTLSLNSTYIEEIENVCAHMKCILLLIAGRALDVYPVLPKVDALVVGWLPGTEAAGIADVIIGEYDFKGRLPFNWFKTIDQLPIQRGNLMDSLFTNGFGLGKDANILVGVP